MKHPKISIIGGGSGGFTVELIHDLCLTPSLHEATVCLMDIDEERLRNTTVVCQRYAAEFSAPLRITSTTDRREALGGADFVITVALVDGPRRLREGWDIALRHGYRWGGSYHILYDEPFWLNFYQLQLFESITRDMIEYCPAAWHLLVSNPVITATTLLRRKYPQIRMTGLCHGFAAVKRIAGLLGMDPQTMTFEIAGVNHFVWLTHLTDRGEDYTGRLAEWMRTQSEEYFKTPNAGHSDLSPKSLDLFRTFGAIPIGDTAHWTGASWPWWYHTDEETSRRWQVTEQSHWFTYVDRLRGYAQSFRELAADPAKRLRDHFGRGDALTGEPMIPIIESVTCDMSRVIIANILNDGDYLLGLPRDFDVEIPTLVSARGIQGIRTRGLPRPILAHLLRDRVAPVEMELAAYEGGRRDLLLQLVLMDKWTKSIQQARALIDDIFALPYHGALRDHYRT